MEANVQAAIRRSGDIQRNNATKTQSPNGQLGKSDFLNLFMTQLSNQDPLDPMDSSKMVQQVSQLGNMEQLQLVNEKLDGVQKNQKEILAYNSVNYLNKNVSYADNDITLKGGESESFGYFVPEDLKKLKINIINPENGSVVFEEISNDVKPGGKNFEWNGKNKDGDDMPDNDYRISFLATNAKGQRVEIDSSRVSKVTKMKFDNGEPMLFVDGTYKKATDVSFIESPPNFEGAEPLMAEMKPFAKEIQNHSNDPSKEKKVLPLASTNSEAKTGKKQL